MKRIILEQPEVLRLVELGAGHALVRRVGICATDISAYKGEHPFLEYPCIPRIGR